VPVLSLSGARHAPWLDGLAESSSTTWNPRKVGIVGLVLILFEGGCRRRGDD
jgi:hypothetical protein